MSQTIRDLLKVDPLAEAERLTGQSYKDDEGTMALGFLLNLDHSARKAEALTAAGDTHFNQSWDDALATYERLGFERVHSSPIDGEDYEDELTIWWHPDGLLLRSESYHGREKVNSATVYYNVRRVDRDRFWPAVSSGSFVSDDVWAGGHDAREGLAAKLAGLREVGEFLPTWERRPFLWLLSYMDSKADGYDHAAITEGRIAGLPEGVRSAIGEPW